MTPTITAASIAFVTSMLLCGLFVATKRHHIKKSGDIGGIGHKSHEGVVPRVGGVGIYIGVLLACLTFSVQTQSSVALITALCLLPAFFTGLIEDFTAAVQPLHRFMGTVLSALLITATTGLSISQVGIIGLDPLLSVPLFGLAFFAFAFSSMAHAFNLIDGLNGLCGGVTAILGVTICTVAIMEGAHLALLIASAVTAANLAFLLFNYPSAQLFMGDNGAYVNGGFLALASVALIENSSTVSPWFAFALFAYPTYETLFTMYRRVKRGRNFMEPDTLHLHSLLSLSTKHGSPIVWLTCLSYCFIAVVFREQPAVLITVSLFVVMLYNYSYKKLAHH